MTKRISKQELKRDRFVDTTFDWALWIRENTRIVAVLVGAVLLVVMALLLYRRAQDRGSARAAVRFGEVQGAYDAGNYQLAANDFKQFINQYGESDFVDEATLYLADSYFKAGDYPSAVSTLANFESRYGDSPLTYGAVSLLAASYEASGDLVKAAETYDKARDTAGFDYQRAAALMDRGRVLAAAGDKAKGAEAYREILEKYPNTPAAREAGVRLAEVTVAPIAGSPSSAPADSAVAAAAPSAAAPATAEVPDPGGSTDDGVAAAKAATSESGGASQGARTVPPSAEAR